MTTVFSAYVTTSGQAWADFDVYVPERWASDLPRRRAAGIPGDLEMATKPELAAGQVRQLLAAGLPARWAATDEVYGRSGKLRAACEKAALAYVAIIPCDFRITLPSGTVIRADEAVKDAVWERRSCGTGTKGPRISDWALIATGHPRRFLLIRRLMSRPDQLTFHLCYAPEGRPATLTPSSATPCAAASSSLQSPRPRTRPGRTALPPAATTTLTALTCVYPSATRRSPHTQASPARTASG